MSDRKTCFKCNCHFYPVRSDQMFCCKGCRQSFYNKYNALILPIKGKWFQMILSGIKKEEYRERKEYWKKRFERYFGYGYGPVNGNTDEFGWRFLPIEKEVIFRNGYQKNAPEFTATVKIVEKEGNPEWGAVPGEIYYTLQIGHIYNLKNCEKKDEKKNTI